MRTFNVAVLFIMLLAFAGCGGDKARNDILIPNLEASWPGVAADAKLGGATDATLDAFSAALQSRDRLAIATRWPSVKAFAEGGIKARNASVGVSASLMERIKQFDAAVALLARRLN